MASLGVMRKERDKRTIPKVFNGIRLVHRRVGGARGAAPVTPTRAQRHNHMQIVFMPAGRPNRRVGHQREEGKKTSLPLPLSASPSFPHQVVKLFLFQTRCNVAHWRGGRASAFGSLFLRVAGEGRGKIVESYLTRTLFASPELDWSLIEISKKG